MNRISDKVLLVPLFAGLFGIGARGVIATGGESRPGTDPVLTPQQSGTDALLQAVSAVSGDVVWVAGHRGTYARTTDGGRTWNTDVVPGADTLEFRDVHAVDARTVYLLAAGPGELSQIYKTVDAGRTWARQFLNREPEAFYGCFDFWDEQRGIALSDSVDGELILIVTDDGGETWTRIPPERVPDALPGEGGFAASGTCVVTGPAGRAWIGTGNSPAGRVHRTTDYGRSWSVSTVPVVAGEMAGVFTVAFRDTLHGIALGGDLARQDEHMNNVAATADGGATWELVGRPRFAGTVYGSAYVPGTTATVVAVGPGGMDYSPDEGRTWLSLDTETYWAVGFSPDGPGWAVGPQGRIVRIDWR